MEATNPKVDNYLIEGCGRCKLVGTPECKVHTWPDELRELRRIVLESGLTEELKWSQPCYTFEGKNIGIVAAFREYASLSFFKGALLKDAAGLLTAPGENSQAVRQLRFTDVKDILAVEAAIKTYIQEAIQIEKDGLKVELKPPDDLDLPEELQSKLDEDPALKAAFEALTPGRQRGYVLFISGAKQSETRSSRVEKYRQQILDGKGMYDR